MAAAEEYRVVFWSPPNGDEVRAAFSSIEEVFGDPFRVDSDEIEKQTTLLSTSGHSSSGNSLGSDDWMEPAAYALNSTALLTRDHRNVLDAFRLLQKDPNVQIVNMLFHPDGDEEKPDFYSDAVKVSFMLSVFIFIMVAIRPVDQQVSVRLFRAPKN
ncbi:hypothetical protein GUJ93_ZPchr0014g47197 [Zizania palustris]|uniref:Uncharacterized protein n=1 Tax=Zizania palustris TaxID=103762 RepID=A0A8J5VS72_ZIZPA|nr:hypothetical protein GUJ93_ZPchr0014g47197 [Zizania palustris]